MNHFFTFGPIEETNKFDVSRMQDYRENIYESNDRTVSNGFWLVDPSLPTS